MSLVVSGWGFPSVLGPFGFSVQLVGVVLVGWGWWEIVH